MTRGCTWLVGVGVAGVAAAVLWLWPAEEGDVRGGPAVTKGQATRDGRGSSPPVSFRLRAVAERMRLEDEVVGEASNAVRTARSAVMAAEAVARLSGIPTRAATDALVDIACGKWADALVRRLAVQALGRRGDDEGLNCLGNLASGDEDPYLRAEAALALGESGKVAAGDLARLYGEEQEAMVRRALARALAREGSAEAAAFLLTRAGEVPDARDLLEPLATLEDSRALEVLAEKVAAGAPPDVLVACARALGRMHDPRALGILISLLATERPVEVRIAAAQALGLLGDPGSLEPLRLVADDVKDPASEAAELAMARVEFVTSKR